MTRYVVDTSVIVKWFVEEEGTASAIRLRTSAQLLAPDLILPEFANVLWKKVRRKELDRADAVDALRAIRRAGLTITPGADLLEDALSMFFDLSHPVYDCAFLALAQRSDCQFVTADVAFARRVTFSPLRSRIVMLQDVPF